MQCHRTKLCLGPGDEKKTSPVAYISGISLVFRLDLFLILLWCSSFLPHNNYPEDKGTHIRQWRKPKRSTCTVYLLSPDLLNLLSSAPDYCLSIEDPEWFWDLQLAGTSRAFSLTLALRERYQCVQRTYRHPSHLETLLRNLFVLCCCERSTSKLWDFTLVRLREVTLRLTFRRAQLWENMAAQKPGSERRPFFSSKFFFLDSVTHDGQNE